MTLDSEAKSKKGSRDEQEDLQSKDQKQLSELLYKKAVLKNFATFKG